MTYCQVLLLSLSVVDVSATLVIYCTIDCFKYIVSALPVANYLYPIIGLLSTDGQPSHRLFAARQLTVS